MNEYDEQAQKEFNTVLDWIGEMIHRELWKRLKIYHSTKWYVHKTESLIENETYKILWSFSDENRSPTRPVGWEIGVQSLVESYQILKNATWYLFA